MKGAPSITARVALVLQFYLALTNNEPHQGKMKRKRWYRKHRSSDWLLLVFVRLWVSYKLGWTQKKHETRSTTKMVWAITGASGCGNTRRIKESTTSGDKIANNRDERTDRLTDTCTKLKRVWLDEKEGACGRPEGTSCHPSNWVLHVSTIQLGGVAGFEERGHFVKDKN